MNKPKTKKCKVCRTEYIPGNAFQKVCGLDCAREMAGVQIKKEFNKETKRRKKELSDNDLSHQLKLTQQTFNKMIRLRDSELPCISCQRHHSGQYHAGHYKTTASRPDLRFNENNVHKQCSACNNHLSGNVNEYRVHLINKIGLEAVEVLECEPKERKKYNCDELKDFRAELSRKIKGMQDD